MKTRHSDDCGAVDTLQPEDRQNLGETKKATAHEFLRFCSWFETRSTPSLARCCPRSFTFYVAPPARSIPAFLIDL